MSLLLIVLLYFFLRTKTVTLALEFLMWLSIFESLLSDSSREVGPKCQIHFDGTKQNKTEKSENFSL